MNEKDKEEFEKWFKENSYDYYGYEKNNQEIGWKAACEYKQKMIDELEKDKEEFDKWRLEYISTHTGYFKMIGTDDLAQVTWQAACEYKQKEIDELNQKLSNIWKESEEFYLED